jgi:hypothetical protein
MDEHQIVKLTEMKEGFASPVYFERTGKWRSRIIDCTREELIDLSFKHINELEKVDGMLEQMKEFTERALGWRSQL